MEKRTKIILGVGALAVVGYFVWKNNQPKDIFKNATGKGGLSTAGDIFVLGSDKQDNLGCPCKNKASAAQLAKADVPAPKGWSYCAGGPQGNTGAPDKMCKD